ncbi:MAG: penicillin-binding protein activator [Candidatus Krumholzibacteriia bacterium]
MAWMSRLVRLVRSPVRIPAAAVLVLAAVAAGLLAGCGGTRGGGDQPPSIHGTGDEQALRLFGRLEREHALQRDAQAVDLVHSLLDYHPDFPRLDEALALGAASARRLGDLGTALDLTDARLRRLPAGPDTAPLLRQAAGLAAAAADTVRAADYLLRAGQADPAHAGPGSLGEVAPLLDALAPDQALALLAAHPGSALRPYLGYRAVRGLLLAGRVDEARALVADLEVSAPGDRWTGEARSVLEDPRQAALPGRRPGTAAVRADRVGLLFPLTGRFAVLGNACVDAALMAAAAAEAETGRRWELVIEDSGGDPVPAALAARRLVTEEGCIALLGALTSAPTAAAALVADRWGVPLVSPTATSDRLWELGPGVFQTNLTAVHEARVLADLAVRVLLKRRFAILHPDDAEGARQAELFRGEVEARGGEVIITRPFPERATDFREPILEVRALRPEVVFVPASVDQMALLGPQLDFHRLGALVLGPSSFKSERLLERTGAVLDGVTFPDDLALVPPAWTAAFHAAWPGANYPREATGLALKTYQAARLLLDALTASGAVERPALTAALQRRLSSRDVDTDGPETFARSVLVVRDGKIVPFPAELYTDAWALVEGAAAADSLAGAGADSLSAGGPLRR